MKNYFTFKSALKILDFHTAFAVNLLQNLSVAAKNSSCIHESVKVKNK
jgi:hypothetical protein